MIFLKSRDEMEINVTLAFTSAESCLLRRYSRTDHLNELCRVDYTGCLLHVLTSWLVYGVMYITELSIVC